MKRNLTLSFLLSLILCMALVLSYCGSLNIFHPITQFKAKMGNNYEMTIEMDFGYYSRGEKTIKRDGSIKYIEDFIYGTGTIEEIYVNTLTGRACKKESSGLWKSSSYEENSTLIGISPNQGIMFPKSLLDALFNSSNYIKLQGADNVYVQKSGVIFETVENVRFAIGSTSCKITMDATIKGGTGEIIIKVSNIGKIELEMPEY